MVICKSTSVEFDPERDIPNLEGKIILITGANSGLGKQSVLEFSRHGPAQIWLAARNLEKAQAAANDIKQQVPGAPIKLLELDLGSFDSIKRAADTVLSETGRLDVLMLNAGIMATPPGMTSEGYEVQFGTNHMGHALLTKLLLPLLQKTARSDSNSDVRVISLSSYGHAYATKGGVQYDSLKTEAEALGPYGRYSQSKLANVLWARQLAKEYPDITVAAVHPGVVSTNLAAGTTGSPKVVQYLMHFANRWLVNSVEKGARNQLWASISKEVQSGEYYEPVGVSGVASKDGQDDLLAKELWDWTEAELQAHGA
ncbi:short-chain dehydrogenase/reductase [Colletotrichum orchidophilum]|uniref:Short-chain dehydrogenase/reductase n=1 Tax=Colletotrichum orchidophilum TaxID=1209926 RepID=A0A1G4BP14_9PEZI|nr:short-chain dehydrogenase/reductase [Colletotrichum orchidophilum]OHF03026.1 short-chain dehydrogenase/reductase [Colletotrichum orchidophilum]